MRNEVLREALMTNSGKIENLSGRVSKLESTLNEINNKLSQLVNEPVEPKIFWESMNCTHYSNYGRCFIRMSEEDFKKFKNGEKIDFDLYKENSDFISMWTNYKVMDTVDGNAIQIGDTRFVVRDFAPTVINDDETRRIAKISYKSPFIKNPNRKLRAEDFKPLFEKLGFDEWYKEVVLPHKEVMEKYNGTDDEEERIKNDTWEENISLKDKYARIADMLSWFDIDKITRNIVRVNLASDNGQDKIVTFRVDNEDVSSIRNGLYEDMKKCVEDYFKYGEANNEVSYKEYQHGRVHLLTIRCHDKNDGDYDKVRLFWTNEDVDEDVYDTETI